MMITAGKCDGCLSNAYDLCANREIISGKKLYILNNMVHESLYNIYYFLATPISTISYNALCSG